MRTGASKPSISQAVAIVAVGQGGDALAHRALGALEDHVRQRLDVGEIEFLEKGQQLAAADLVADHLRVHVAQHLLGRAHVRAQELEHRLDRHAGLVQLEHRDEQALLEHLARIGGEPAAADVERMAAVAEQRDHTITFEDRGHDGDVVELRGGLPGVVGDQHVARAQAVDGVLGQKMMHAGGHRVDVPGRAGDRLGDHAPAPVEHAGRQVARLAHDRGERGAHQSRRLLVDHADQAVPQHLEHELVHGVVPSPQVRSAIRFKASSMRALASGPRITVDSRSSTIAGPSNASPGASR